MSTQSLLFGAHNGVFGRAINISRPSKFVKRLKQINHIDLNFLRLVLSLSILCVIATNLSSATSNSYNGSTSINKQVSGSTPSLSSNGTGAGQAKSSSPTETCNDPQAYYESDFFNCPSFAVDFNKVPNGPVSSNIFNIESGSLGVNDEAEYYTDNTQNVRVQNGNLIIEALNQSDNGYKYTSARLDTAGKEDFLYGKIVVRAQLPSSVGTWPAIWMLPTNNIYKNNGNQNPNRDLNDGELDIAETVGIQPHTIYGIAHSLSNSNGGTGYYSTINIPNSNSAFHDYSLSWTPTSLTYAVDNHVFYTVNKQSGADYKSWPYDQQFHLILNLAIGGSWGGGDKAQYPPDGVDASALPATMKVSSIDYYAYNGQ